MSEEQNRLVGAVAKMSELPDSEKVDIRGKRYAEVHTRVQIFRETYGDDGKIISTIHVADDTKVLAETSISVFVDGSWRVIANDFAEEYRASGPVNKTSAVENCLTSSIGRALSACGLSGGNYASFDEVNHAINDKAEAPKPKAKAKAKTEKPAAKPKPKPEVKPKPDAAVKTKDIEDYALGEIAEITSAEGAENLVGFMLQLAGEFSETPDQLKDFYRKNKATIDIIDRDWNEQYEKLREGFSALKDKFLTKEDE
tara:strand:+ start:125 stop:892 length:768 start_codon:yes stop_codon:yes gene_type:complete